jgi:DNA-binding MarR family transcriptional regulator
MGGKRAKPHVNDLARRINEECAAYRLRVVNRAITRIYDEALRPFGLRIAQLNTLVVVMESGGITPNELSQRMHMDASTVSRNVERMCQNGWLELVSLEDARSHAIHMTAKGQKLVREASVAWEKAQAETEEILGAQVIKALWRAVDRIELAGDGE